MLCARPASRSFSHCVMGTISYIRQVSQPSSSARRRSWISPVKLPFQESASTVMEWIGGQAHPRGFRERRTQGFRHLGLRGRRDSLGD